MAYSQYFNFGSDPHLETRSRWVSQQWIAGGDKVSYDVVAPGRQDLEAAKEFDQILAGHDKATAKYTETLKSLYDDYSKYATEYEGNVQPIMDALTGDIADLQDYIGQYKAELAASKDDFNNGLILDPNAKRTQSEYMGAVADQYDTARDSLRRNMSSQGLNPYANKGADRELSLSRASDLGKASGQAYSDWRQQYNQDKQTNLGNKATYLSLLGNVGGMYGDVMNARAGLGNMYQGIYANKMAANQAKATGYEGLANQAEARRQEALALGQQQQENARRQNDLMQQQKAKLTGRDKYLESTGNPTTTGLLAASF